MILASVAMVASLKNAAVKIYSLFFPETYTILLKHPTA